MSLLFRGQRAALSDFAGFFPRAARGGGSAPVVTGDSAMRHSAVWASRRLRANLISSLPVDVYRPVPPSGRLMGVPRPKVLIEPSPGCLWHEWMASSQMDKDGYGNTFGTIEERDGAGKPARIDLVPAAEVSVRRVKGVISYRIRGHLYPAEDIWHERQYTVPGSPVGLSPITYAALAVAQGISAQEFAARWYSGNAMPNAVLRNSEMKLSRKASQEAKDSFTESMSQGGVWATGKDWEFNPVQAQSNDTQYLEAMNASSVDIARFFDVPADLIDAPVQGSAVTYANITQRNLQFLVMNLGPAIQRRETAFSTYLVANPRVVKLNTRALLRLDPQTQVEVLGKEIADGRRTTDEARALVDDAPLTDEQIARQAQIVAALKSAQKPTPGGSPQ